MAAYGDSYGTVTIGATAALIKAGRAQRNSILVQNVHASNDLYVGLDASVSTSNGIKIAAGQSMEIYDGGSEVYGIASGAGTDVRFMEIG